MTVDEPSDSVRPQERLRAGTALLSESLDAAIERERVQLMQIQAMVKCVSEVLLYADDDDSTMHADVAKVSARLLIESVTRLEILRMQVRQLVEAASEQAEATSLDTIPPGMHQVKEGRPLYLC